MKLIREVKSRSVPTGCEALFYLEWPSGRDPKTTGEEQKRRCPLVVCVGASRIDILSVGIVKRHSTTHTGYEPKRRHGDSAPAPWSRRPRGGGGGHQSAGPSYTAPKTNEIFERRAKEI